MPGDDLDLIEDVVTAPSAPPWHVLVVDDDEEVHSVTRLALDGFTFMARPVQIISAHSAAEAREILSRFDDIALVLLDVVMESESAGFDVVTFIRDYLGNRTTRIVLRTGQPGQQPPADVIRNHEIDDYRTKTELTFDRLHIIATTALRTYHLLKSMAEQQRVISHQATHDELTDLPNRTLLQDRIVQSLATARRKGTQVALLFIDLDGFKFINDTFGHSAGDILLKCIANRLRAHVRESDTVARLGGDEFVAMLPDLQSPADALQIADKLLQALAEPVSADGHSLVITASIGISVHPDDGEDVEALLKNADAALYNAKELGRNRIQCYHIDLSSRSSERVAFENALRQALTRHQFELHYQPRVEISDNQVSGIEAQLMWRHPKLGLMSQDRFIPLAEELGLTVPIGEWTLYTAGEQLRRWQRKGADKLNVSVDITPRQFSEQDITTLIRNVLSDTGLAPDALNLQVSECALIKDPDQVMDAMEALKAIKVALTMNDFGTGYSNLSYLNRLPIDSIKIDQSFVTELARHKEAASIARTIIMLAKFLGRRTICEGVDTHEQLAYLAAAGCDSAQGHYFGDAMPAVDLHIPTRRRLPKSFGAATGDVSGTKQPGDSPNDLLGQR